MKILGDGSVIPSNLSMAPTKSARDRFQSDPFLKQGTVTSIIYADDVNSISKKAIEYNVAVVERDGTNGTTLSYYKNCRMSDAFGTSNNYIEYTAQPAEKTENGLPQIGAQVLILCIDGKSSNGSALIIGGIGNDNRPKRTKDDGQFYDFMFNGVNMNINKEGEYTLTFNTPIDSDGKKKDDKAAGTQIKIDKEGKLTISDNEKQVMTFDRVNQSISIANGAESVIIDKKNKSISIVSSGDMTEDATGKMNIKSGKDMSLDSGGKISAKSEQAISMESGAAFDMKSSSGWKVDAGGSVTIKSGGAVQIEGGSMASLKGAITKLGDGSVPAAGVGISMVFGLGNLGFPVSSQILTGSSTVMIGT